jgi:hypothetical protein
MNSLLDRETAPMGIDAYAAALADCRTSILPGLSATYWIRYESFGIMRLPTFCTIVPSRDEVEGALRTSRAVAASYLIPPDDGHSANAWLYICRNQAYRLEDLSVAGRRDARRATRSFQFRFLDWPTVYAQGLTAFADTRRRVGLSDGTPEQFRRRMERFASHPAHAAVGALKDDVLCAFMTLAVVDDWVEIEGCFSADQHRSLCPNDGLAHFVLSHYLAEGRVNTVSYGLSSVQDTHPGEGLHLYKQKVGFEAIPVHRAFVLHPMARPFVTPLTRQGVTLIRRLFPRHRLLKKADGILASLLQKHHPAGTSTGEHPHG